jgi:hypothetical protein
VPSGREPGPHGGAGWLPDGRVCCRCGSKADDAHVALAAYDDTALGVDAVLASAGDLRLATRKLGEAVSRHWR